MLAVPALVKIPVVLLLYIEYIPIKKLIVNIIIDNKSSSDP